MIEGRPRESLVLYEMPMEVGPGVDPLNPNRKSFQSLKKATLAPIENKPLQASNILNEILPPREWVEQGK